MAYKVDNAVILAAGMSSRFAPLSYECPKALLNVRGEVLIERQIRQLQEAGVPEIILVTGYKKERFAYLQNKYGVLLVENKEYQTRNNHASIYAAKHFLKNTYICSSDHYFCRNPFKKEEAEPYYAAVYADGVTDEWCLKADKEGWITDVAAGGKNQWYMMGHAFWNETFSRNYMPLLEAEYNQPQARAKFWETIYKEHTGRLKLKIKKYPAGQIFEFDSLDELRRFDKTYRNDTRCRIIKKIAGSLACGEEELTEFLPLFDDSQMVTGVLFTYRGQQHRYIYENAAGNVF